MTSEIRVTGFITVIRPKRQTKMKPYKPPLKVLPHDVLNFIRQFHKKFQLLPTPKQIALFLGVTPQTIYSRLNDLEKMGQIKRVKVNSHKTLYKIL